MDITPIPDHDPQHSKQCGACGVVHRRDQLGFMRSGGHEPTRYKFTLCGHIGVPFVELAPASI